MFVYFAVNSYPKTKTVIQGVPFDRTSSFIPGSRFAPSQIRTAFANVESYSPYQKQDLTSYKIYDAGDVFFPIANTRPSFNQIRVKTKRHLAKGKKVLSLGGEHTITIPLVEIHKEYYPKLRVVQFDAHADLRDEFLGEKMCHATTMRRVSEIVGKKNIFPLGIRSMASEETKYKIYPFGPGQHIKKIKQLLGNAPVYITLDIDVLDTSVMPAVATPEPGGWSFAELISTLTEMNSCNIVGADLVEYNPLTISSFAYASTAAVIVREMLLLLANNQNKRA
jgi:agmatinase